MKVLKLKQHLYFLNKVSEPWHEKILWSAFTKRKQKRFSLCGYLVSLWINTKVPTANFYNLVQILVLGSKLTSLLHNCFEDRYPHFMRKIVFAVCMVFAANVTFSQSDVNEKLKSLNIELITPGKPMANYVKGVRTGNLLFLAGHGPTKGDGTSIVGKVGKDLTVEQGIEAARVTAISLLSTIKAEIGDLNKVKRIVKVNGWVNCHSDFTDQPKVINGCSDLLVAVFGEKGKHARAALGANALPSNIAVEIEMVVEIED